MLCGTALLSTSALSPWLSSGGAFLHFWLALFYTGLLALALIERDRGWGLSCAIACCLVRRRFVRCLYVHESFSRSFAPVAGMPYQSFAIRVTSLSRRSSCRHSIGCRIVILWNGAPHLTWGHRRSLSDHVRANELSKPLPATPKGCPDDAPGPLRPVPPL